jgi:hypothetical protein
MKKGGGGTGPHPAIPNVTYLPLPRETFTPSLPAAGGRSREATEFYPSFVFTTLTWYRSGATEVVVTAGQFRRLALSFPEAVESLA